MAVKQSNASFDGVLQLQQGTLQRLSPEYRRLEGLLLSFFILVHGKKVT